MSDTAPARREEAMSQFTFEAGNFDTLAAEKQPARKQHGWDTRL